MVIQFIQNYFIALWELTIDMAPYLLLGFLIAGILHIYFPADKVNKFMGGRNLKSVINASLFGIPLPLCSCGVIPTGISFYKNGASKGPTNAFLISTPQTGIDSILVTYSMLGLPMAIIRPIIAFVSGIVGGIFTNKLDNDTNQTTTLTNKLTTKPKYEKGALREMLNYAFVTFLQDISKWLIIGLLLAALMAVAIPENFFTTYVENEYLSLAIVLVASVPLYVCATGSVPIAAVLIAKGLSPGAAIVFLMAGPATNAATITVIGNVMGKKALTGYLTSIIGGAIFFGILVNEFLPRDWFTDFIPTMGHVHGDHFPPYGFNIASATLLIGLILNGYRLRYKYIFSKQENEDKAKVETMNEMEQKTVIVNGMTCNHCKANVERNLSSIEGIKTIEVDLTSSKVKISGDRINLNEIKQTVEGIGYEYAGEA